MIVAQMLSLIRAAIALIWAFFSPSWAWSPLAIAAVFVMLVLLSLKRKKWQHVDDLSPEANDLLMRYGHYYALPYSGRDFSAAVSTLMFAAVALGVLGALKGFWWGLLIGAALWFALGPIAKAFNPTNFLDNPLDQRAHEEIIRWVTTRPRVFASGTVSDIGRESS
jgi:hypothetical protein